MKVLIVEDNEQIQRTLGRLLRRQFGDVDLCIADNADLAIEHLTASVLDREFDLVISDWNLVGPRTGGDVLHWIGEHASHLAKRFLFVSSDDAAQGHGVPWLDKGGDITELRTTIQHVLDARH